MNQWYPSSWDQQPGPGETQETTGPAAADKPGYPAGRNPGQGRPSPGANGRPAADVRMAAGPSGWLAANISMTAAATREPPPLAHPEQLQHLHKQAGRSAVLHGLLAAVALILLIARLGHASLSSEALAAVAALMLAARALQIRSKRRRINATIPGPTPRPGTVRPGGYSTPRAPGTPRPLTFSQQHCSVVRVAARGNVNTGMPAADFLVQVAGDTLSVTEAPGLPVFTVPANAVQITTPRWQRKFFGAGSILMIDRRRWSVQFDRVHRAEAARTRRAGGIGMMLTAGSPRQSIRRGREINACFVHALLEAGATAAAQPASGGRPAPGAGRRGDALPPRDPGRRVQQRPRGDSPGGPPAADRPGRHRAGRNNGG